MNYFIIPGLKFREPSQIDEKMIIFIVCDYFKVSYDDVKKKTRERRVVIARQNICYFVRKYTPLTLMEIGRLIGNRDHTTVIHSINMVNDFLHIKDVRFMKIVFEIETQFEITMDTIP